jgi:hypothetical protein
VYAASALPGERVRLRGFDAHRWVAPASLGGLPQSNLTRKALSLASDL